MGTAVLVSTLAAATAVLVLQVGSADLAATLTGVQLPLVAMAVAVFALSIVAAAYTIIGFSPVRTGLSSMLLAQLAVGAVRLVTPAAVTTPAVITRFLMRSGSPLSSALATVGTAQSAQLLATGAVLAGLATASGESIDGPSATTWLLIIAAAVALLLTLFALRRNSRVMAFVGHARSGVADVVAHGRRHPGRLLVGLLASAALTLTHVLAFALCVRAVGADAPLVALALVYLGSSAAGSLVPTPGGIGPVEAALVAGLTALGVPLPAATAAALLSRLVSVWLPAVPGALAVLVLRRRALL